jgi:hypothetical protein
MILQTDLQKLTPQLMDLSMMLWTTDGAFRRCFGLGRRFYG